MLDKLSQQNKEEAPISAMHFWTPQYSLKDIKYNYFKLGFHNEANNQKVSRSISPFVSELFPLGAEKPQYWELINRANSVGLSCVLTSAYESIVQRRV